MSGVAEGARWDEDGKLTFGVSGPEVTRDRGRRGC